MARDDGPDLGVLGGAEEDAEDQGSAEGLDPEAIAAAMGGGIGGGGTVPGLDDDEDDSRKKKGPRISETHDVRATFVGATAYLEPAVAALFRSWEIRHRKMLEGMALDQKISVWIAAALTRDYMADPYRPEDKREYDDAALFLEALAPLFERERQADEGEKVRKARIDATTEQRQAIVERLRAMQAPEPYIEAVLAAGGTEGDG